MKRKDIKRKDKDMKTKCKDINIKYKDKKIQTPYPQGMWMVGVKQELLKLINLLTMANKDVSIR